jgi:hypothetical protein
MTVTPWRRCTTTQIFCSAWAWRPGFHGEAGAYCATPYPARVLIGWDNAGQRTHPTPIPIIVGTYGDYRRLILGSVDQESDVTKSARAHHLPVPALPRPPMSCADNCLCRALKHVPTTFLVSRFDSGVAVVEA